MNKEQKEFVRREFFKSIQFDKAVDYILSHPEQCCCPIPEDSQNPADWMMFWSANLLLYGYAHKMKPRSVKRFRRNILKYYKYQEK